ncbi:MAG: polysaccharide deacetylase [Ideonella sp.]|nr:polysaccharide deacetylase [Ideonella sp.]MCC7455374.1 hypothetical protein [Nitrospira sp.]
MPRARRAGAWVLLLSCWLLGWWPASAAAQLIGITFDDLPDPAHERQAAASSARILHELRLQQVHSLVFPALGTGDEARMASIGQWAAAGHGVGNGGARPRNLSAHGTPLEAFIADVRHADEVLHTLPTWQPLLRFPYLKEGDTRAKRDGMRQWLREHGYRAAPASIDTSDAYFNERYLALRAAGRSEPVRRLKRAYVQHLLQRATYYDDLARRVLGRSPSHVLRLHVNALNAAALHDAIEAFRGKGWHFVSARSALDDPLYALQPDVLPAGGSIVWQLARARGVDDLRNPPEDVRYERPLLRRQGLAP